MICTAEHMSTAVARSWTCPQCQRRVPGREPRCHCGFERAHAGDARAAGAARASGDARASAGGQTGRRVVLVAALVACVGVLLYGAFRPRAAKLGIAPRTADERSRGEAIYPALPAMPTKKAPSPRVVHPRPVAAAPTPAELADLSLRKIAAETSVLDLTYRPFAEACLTLVGDASSFPPGSTPDSHWLPTLQTARLRSGVTLRDKAAPVDCPTARTSLVARADA
jgi:hypothetical protein